MSPYLCSPHPFLTQRPEGFFYNESDHVSPLLRALHGLLSYRKSQSHCDLKGLNYLEHPPSPCISLTSPIRYSPQCYSGSGLPRIPQKLPSVLLSRYSLCLEYSSHRYLHGSLPQPPSGVYLNECFILLFFENSGVRYFLIPQIIFPCTFPSSFVVVCLKFICFCKFSS